MGEGGEDGQITPTCLKSISPHLPQGEGRGLIFQQVSLWVADPWSDGLSGALGCLTRDVVCLQTLSFYFPPCGKIPPPVIMVQNVSFKYTKDGVSPGSVRGLWGDDACPCLAGERKALG